MKWTQADVDAATARIAKAGMVRRNKIETPADRTDDCVITGATLSKYKNERIVNEHGAFQSKRELEHYIYLLWRKKAGLVIGEIERQVKFILVAGCRIRGRQRPPIRYFADFVWTDERELVRVQDTKGFVTEPYRLKRHMMKVFHNIDIEEI